MSKRHRRKTKRRPTYVVLLGASLLSIALAVPLLADGDPEATSPEPPEPVNGSLLDFNAVAGPSCPEDETRRVRFSSAPGAAGWQRGNSGNGPKSGCGNGFLYVDPGYAAENVVQWLFTFGSPATRSCRIDVFVPDSPHASAEVWYDVGDRFENTGDGITSFTVDQLVNRGRWVRATSVLVETATLLVHLDGGGQDLTPDRTALAAGAVGVSCTRPATR